LAAAFAGDDSIRAILLDIEGTTTPIDFVYKTLFPYARANVERFLLEHAGGPDVRAGVDALREQHRADAGEDINPPKWVADSPDTELASATTYALWLMGRDSKCPALKSLQGKIWQEGYAKGQLRGEVYPDVPPAFARWSRQGKIIVIFSSGSVLAQKLLFSSTTAGDLTRNLRAHFDTTTGPKSMPTSYLKIAETLATEPRAILFISDVERELDAAEAAGMHTALCVRTESAEQLAGTHWIIHSFEEIFAES
jgi:enolase-phosphatase E1